MAEKTIGSGKTRNEKWLQITLSEKTLQELLGDLDEFQGHKFVKLNVNIQDEADKFGKNIRVSRDRYKPSQGNIDNYVPSDRTERVQQINEKLKDESKLPF